jgi:hypothetical protein
LRMAELTTTHQTEYEGAEGDAIKHLYAWRLYRH